jgi:hypothetical protein
MEYSGITASKIKAGDALPELAVDVSATTVVLGALASRDWRPMHHDKDLNTPNQAAWFERYVTDWTGPTGRLGRMKFRMKDSVFPGDRMVFHGVVDGVETDDTGCSWVDLTVTLTVEDKTTTQCTARVAVPASDDDNPWKRKGGDWKP